MADSDKVAGSRSRRRRGTAAVGGVACLLLGAAMGCSGDSDTDPSQAFLPHGAHGGHLAEMPDVAGYTVEFTLDDRSRRVVLYVQEVGTSKPYPLAVASLSGRFVADGRSADVDFAADPRQSDPPGKASRYALGLDEVPQQLIASNQFVLELACPDGADGEAVTASIPHKNNHAHEYCHD